MFVRVLENLLAGMQTFAVAIAVALSVAAVAAEMCKSKQKCCQLAIDK